jgi:hypothetical protein
MLIQVVTTWEGSPAGLEKIVEGSKQAGPIHESMGAKNPRLWRAGAGGNMEQAYYSIEFDSQEAYGKFSDAMLNSEWWANAIEWIGEQHPDLLNLGTTIYYDAIS